MRKCLCSFNRCVWLQDAHDGSLTSLYFFPGEPLLMSAAADNSLKHWLFDSADGTARLLRFRSGHSAPPSCLKFYGTGNKLLSAGKTRRDCCCLEDAIYLQPAGLWLDLCDVFMVAVGLDTELISILADHGCIQWQLLTIVLKH